MARKPVPVYPICSCGRSQLYGAGQKLCIQCQREATIAAVRQEFQQVIADLPDDRYVAVFAEQHDGDYWKRVFPVREFEIFLTNCCEAAGKKDFFVDLHTEAEGCPGRSYNVSFTGCKVNGLDKAALACVRLQKKTETGLSWTPVGPNEFGQQYRDSF